MRMNPSQSGTWTWDSFDRTGKRIAQSKWKGKTLVSTDVPDVPVKKKDDKLPEPEGE